MEMKIETERMEAWEALIRTVGSLLKTFERELLAEIDEAVYKVARRGGDLSPLIDRLQWFSQILDLHAQGEEEVAFPALDRVAPLLASLFVTTTD